MWKCASTNGGDSSWPEASIVDLAAALMLRATLTMRPPATRTSIPDRPSGSVALRISRSAMRCARRSSFRPEDPVAGIAEPRPDVAVVVQLAIDRRRVDRHVGVRLLKRRDALRPRHEADEADRTRMRFLQSVHGRHRRMAS